jgi:uncharacterized protein (TIGR00369 family)
MYNPLGTVHGGAVCTLLDTVTACAMHTTLPEGVGYTSVEIKVNYLKAVTATSGRLTAAGTVVKRGHGSGSRREGSATRRETSLRRRPAPCWCSSWGDERRHRSA